MIVKLLTEHYLEFLSLRGDCTDSSDSTLVKMPHCWKSHAKAHIVCSTFSGKTHEYDIIPYSDDIFSSSEPLDATSGRPDQIALYQHVEKQVPDLSCLISSGTVLVKSLYIAREN